MATFINLNKTVSKEILEAKVEDNGKFFEEIQF